MTESEALINSLRAEMEKNQQLREQLSAKEQVRSFQSLTFTHAGRTGEAGSHLDTRARGGTGAPALCTTHACTYAHARRAPAGLGVLMGAAAQVIAGIEREKRDLERDLERRNIENRNTLQMMASLQDSHQQQVPTARRPDGCPLIASTSGVSVCGVLQTQEVLCCDDFEKEFPVPSPKINKPDVQVYACTAGGSVHESDCVSGKQDRALRRGGCSGEKNIKIYMLFIVVIIIVSVLGYLLLVYSGSK